VAEVTSLGLVQMTRKRVGAGLLEAFSTPCECCGGRGVILTFDLDADSPGSHHTHSRGQAANAGNSGRIPAPVGISPASVAARARPVEIPPPDAQAADAQAADLQTADVEASAEPQPADGRPDSPVSPAQTDNGQAPDAQAEPARSGSSSSRRRRRKPSAAAVPVASTAPDTPQASPPEAPGAADMPATQNGAA
jgi:ribonuclease E